MAKAGADPPGIQPRLDKLKHDLGSNAAEFDSLVRHSCRLAGWVARRAAAKRALQPREAYILGITGAQGSGKTTIARLLALLLERNGLRTATLSLDDIYLTYEQRQYLKESCPHYRFRGPFGTHDVDLGLSVLHQLKRCQDDGVVRIPVFDKSLHHGEGDRLPESEWRSAGARQDVVIFEGWCLGAQPLKESSLAMPVNSIESAAEYDDAEGTFRRRINAELRSYQELFGEIDDLAVLHVGNVERIYRWRMRQEQGLKQQAGVGMDADTLRAFVDYFLPTTERYILPLGEYPEGRADIVLALGAGHQIESLRFVADEIHARPVQ